MTASVQPILFRPFRTSNQLSALTTIHIPGFGRLRPGQMRYMRGEWNYTRIFLERGKPLMSATTLMAFQHCLPGWIRISKNYLINPDYVISYERVSARSLTITMQDGTRLAVSRRRIPYVISRLQPSIFSLCNPV